MTGDSRYLQADSLVATAALSSPPPRRPCRVAHIPPVGTAAHGSAPADRDPETRDRDHRPRHGSAQWTETRDQGPGPQTATRLSTVDRDPETRDRDHRPRHGSAQWTETRDQGPGPQTATRLGTVDREREHYHGPRHCAARTA